MQIAWVCLHVIQAASGKKRLKLKDFLLELDKYDETPTEEERRQTVQRIQREMTTWARMHNQKIKQQQGGKPLKTMLQKKNEQQGKHKDDN